MPNYQNGKIYKLICDDPSLVYIGSTCQKYLNSRLSAHKYKYTHNTAIRTTTSRELFEVGGVKIILIEDFPCNTKDELLFRERLHMENMECVNMLRPIITKEEHLENNRGNYSKYKEQKKIYCDKNRERKKEYDKQRYLENKEKINNRVKIYYQENKEKVKQYQKRNNLKLYLNN